MQASDDYFGCCDCGDCYRYGRRDGGCLLKFYLFQGLPKSDKMEFLIQKAVELGVYQVIPVETRRTVVKLDAKKVRREGAQMECCLGECGEAVKAADNSGGDRCDDVSEKRSTMRADLIKYHSVRACGRMADTKAYFCRNPAEDELGSSSVRKAVLRMKRYHGIGSRRKAGDTRKTDSAHGDCRACGCCPS